MHFYIYLNTLIILTFHRRLITLCFCALGKTNRYFVCMFLHNEILTMYSIIQLTKFESKINNAFNWLITIIASKDYENDNQTIKFIDWTLPNILYRWMGTVLECLKNVATDKLGGPPHSLLKSCWLKTKTLPDAWITTIYCSPRLAVWERMLQQESGYRNKCVGTLNEITAVFWGLYLPDPGICGCSPPGTGRTSSHRQWPHPWLVSSGSCRRHTVCREEEDPHI